MGRGRTASTGVALLAIALLVIAFVIGRATAGGGSSPPPASPNATGNQPGPTRSVGGVPAGYARTRDGAVAALLNDSVVLSELVLKPAAQRHAALAQLATAALAGSLGRRLDQAAAQAAQTPVGRGLRAGATTVYRGAPLGYRVLSYSPERAIVQTWAFGLVANDQGLGPQVSFQTATSTLVWQDGDWKLDRTASQPGPTPASAGPVSSPQAFVQVVRGLQGLRYAP